MRSKDYLKNLLPKTDIKSKLKFTQDFNKELQKTMEELAVFLDKELDGLYDMDYVDLWHKNIKIKVNDDNKFIYKMINIVVDYNAVDEKYGNIHFNISIHELSQAPKFFLFWKISVLDRHQACEWILKILLKQIEII